MLRHRFTLLEDIGDPGCLLDALISGGILSPNVDDYANIVALSASADQVCALLDLLPKFGPQAYTCFVDSLRSVRPHLADLLERTALEERLVKERSCVARANGGLFPAAVPSSPLAHRVQLALRRRYEQLARKTTALDFDGGSRTGRGLDDVFVNVSSLEFEEVQETLREGDRRHNARNPGLPHGRVVAIEKNLDRKTFAARRGEARELCVGQLLRCENGERADSCVLVGQAGVGETLLLRWLMLSWAQGRMEELSEFEFVLYVSGRHWKAAGSETVEGVLKAAMEESELTDTELEEIVTYLKGNSRRLLLLFDSVDEAGESWSTSKGLQKVVERLGPGVEDCSLIVTSRPCSMAYDVVTSCMLRYYVVGLSDEPLNELVMRRLGVEKGGEVAERLKGREKADLWELMKWHRWWQVWWWNWQGKMSVALTFLFQP